MDLWNRLLKKKQPEFKPDPRAASWIKTFRFTRTQQLRLGKWGLYIFSILLALVVQDVIMSQVSIAGATTDLVVSVILLITVLEGTEVGSLFVLIASTMYFFTGSAPGAYCIGLMTACGIGAVLLRQMYLHRSRGTITLCAGAAQVLYEVGLFLVGIFTEVTRWDRVGVFLLTGAIGAGTIALIYPLIHKIGLIGGNTWKE